MTLALLYHQGHRIYTCDATQKCYEGLLIFTLGGDGEEALKKTKTTVYTEINLFMLEMSTYKSNK